MQTHYNTAQLAEYLQISKRTLERWRLEGKGPKYFKLGSRVLYSEEQVEAWLVKCQTNSTTESALEKQGNTQ